MNPELEKFHLAVEHTSDHVVITDPKGIIIYANKAVERITGYENSEILNKTIGSLWGNQMGKEYYNELWHTIQNKKVFTGEIINRRKNGEQYHAHVTISPVLDEKNKIIFFVGIERDITKEKEIDKAKSEFISFASHQLRTPLTSIQISLDILLHHTSRTLTAEQKKYLRVALGGIRYMTDIIETLLNISRIQMGTLLVNQEPVNLARFSDDILKSISIPIQKRKIKIKKIYERMPPIKIDQRLMRIIFENIISNAIKYSPIGGTILIEIKKRGKDALIAISDTGIGIPKDQQTKIFEKLFRVRVDNKVKGTGLGLYMVKVAVDQYGGCVWCKSPSSLAFGKLKNSQEQKGTTFFVTVPLSGMTARNDTRYIKNEKT